jgi:hypothetical protein
MGCREGFQIEDPWIMLPWTITPEELERAFDGFYLRKIRESYFFTSCVALRGLTLDVGIRFFTGPKVGIYYLDFSIPYLKTATSFPLIQIHLEATFGKPTISAPGDEGWQSHIWRLDGCVVEHEVRERFGPAHFVRIRKEIAN